MLGLGEGFEIVRKTVEEAASANAGDMGDGGAELAGSVKKTINPKNEREGVNRRKKMLNSVLECQEVTSRVKCVEDKNPQTQRQDMEEGEDLLDTSEEMVDEDQSVDEAHGKLCSSNRGLDGRQKNVVKEVYRKEQGGEGETENTVEESEEDSTLLAIRYYGEVKEVNDPQIPQKMS